MDVLQDCFVEGFINISSGKYKDQGRPLIAYLKGIAHNLICTEYRFSRRTIPLIAENNAGEKFDFPTTVSREADAVDEQIDRNAWIRRARMVLGAALAKIGESKRSVLHKRYIEGKTAHQTGKEMGMTDNNVRQIAYRARTILMREQELRGLLDSLRDGWG